VLQVLGPGDALGWSWAFPPNHWTLTAVALEPVTTLVFPATRLRHLCDDDPVLGSLVFRRISQVLLQRLTATRRRLAVAEHAAAGVPLRITVAPPVERPHTG
jgi:CRP-like cAMP-binding protein